MRVNRAAPRLVVLLAAGSLTILLLACIVPSLSTREQPTQAVPTQPIATPVPGAGRASSGSAITIRISEEDANRWIEGREMTLSEGVDCRDMHVSIEAESMWLMATVEVAQLQGVKVPVEVQIRPVVEGESLRMEVVDIRLGGALGPMSGFVESLVGPGLASAFDADALLAQEGLHVTEVALEDGYIIVTGVPDAP